MILNALGGKPLPVYGDGQQTRSFCYVDDLVEGLIRLMDSSREITGPMNLGNEGEFTIRELAEKVVEQTGSTSNIVFEPLPKDDPAQRRPDITRARTHLGWMPTVQLDQGLEKTIRYFRENYFGSGQVDQVAVANL